MIGSYCHDVGLQVKRFPAPGETVLGVGYLESHGGKGSNQAINARRAGAKVAFVGAVGDDAAGRGALNLWRSEGIDISHTVVRPRSPTGKAFIVITASGENNIVVSSGANETLLPQDVAAARSCIAGASLVLAQLEVSAASVAEAFLLGRRAGAVTVLNAAPAAGAVPDAVWTKTDFLIVNETEARQLTGNITEDNQKLCLLLRSQVRLGAVITLGAMGAIGISADGETVKVASPSIAVVDTTGAGDAFVGAFCSGWLRTLDLRASLQLGTAAGSLACTFRGAFQPLASAHSANCEH